MTKDVTIVSEPSFLSVIDKIASTPGMNPDIIHKMIDAQERVMAKQAEIEFNQAMARLQAVLPVIRHGAQIKHGDRVISTYAKHEDIEAVIRPLYSAEGFSFSFNSELKDGIEIYYGKLSHAAGHSVTAEMRLPADTSGAKNAIQAKGSTISYARRYLVTMLLNLVTSGEDDDGMAGGAATIDDVQAAEIEKLIEDVKADRVGFLKYMKADSVPEIKNADYPKAIAALKAKGAKK